MKRSPTDWWVRIHADGSVRGAVSEEGYKGLSWTPSIGRRVDQADSKQLETRFDRR